MQVPAKGADGGGRAATRRRRWPWPRRSTALDHGAVVIAAITSCTNTSNPSVMIGAGLLAKKAVERGLTRKPWVKSSLAPGSKVVTEYLERRGADAVSRSARLQPGGLRLHDLHRQQRSAARRGLGRHPREEPGRRLGAERQPQLRGPHPAGSARQLPGVAAAGRGLRAGRHDHQGPDHRAARRRPGRQAGLPEGHLADRAGNAGRRCSRPSRRRCSAAATPTSSPATSAGRGWRCPRAAASRGRRTPPTSASRRSSKA